MIAKIKMFIAVHPVKAIGIAFVIGMIVSQIACKLM